MRSLASSIPVLLVLSLMMTGCAERENLDGYADSRQPSAATPAVTPDESPGSGAARSPTAAEAAAPTVIFLGTSLTAGYGLAAEQAYPAVVERLAARDGLPIRAVNAGLSGETSAGALRRVDWVLRAPADVVVVETGANDGLRALDVRTTRENISRIVRRIQQLQPDARVLLVQMEAPPNFGAEYTARFRAMYPEVAAGTGAVLVPFLLEGVAAVREMNQPDGIHPNVTGSERVAVNVWTALKPVVEDIRAGN